jgi:hypothetical protein
MQPQPPTLRTTENMAGRPVSQSPPLAQQTFTDPDVLHAAIHDAVDTLNLEHNAFHWPINESLLRFADGWRSHGSNGSNTRLMTSVGLREFDDRANRNWTLGFPERFG